MKLFTIGSKADNILLEMTIKDMQIDLNVEKFNDITTALSYVQLETTVPDLIMISSGIILQVGRECLSQLKWNDRLKSVPTVILIEFSGEEKYLPDLPPKNGSTLQLGKKCILGSKGRKVYG